MKKDFFVLIVLIGLLGCIGGGTHGYIKRYRYNVSKYVLEKGVHQIISKSATVHQDSIKDYYNDDTNYIRINIIENGSPYAYTFHFYGGKEYWDSSKTSAISIAYAYDKNRKGGSAGNGGVKPNDFMLKKELAEPFEREFINKIDSVLGIKHREE